jgi:hypothetical protein
MTYLLIELFVPNLTMLKDIKIDELNIATGNKTSQWTRGVDEPVTLNVGTYFITMSQGYYVLERVSSKIAIETLFRAKGSDEMNKMIGIYLLGYTQSK